VPRPRGVAGLLVSLVVWVAVLGGVSVAGSQTQGIAAATVSFLVLLWQVQAASVGFAFALALFIFGLLPQSRGRVTYREFLRRSWALWLVTFNVGSLVFDGLVLLGLGHQVPAFHGAAGHGWAVTVATVTGMLSLVSILVLLGRTITVIDPAAGREAERDFRLKAVGQAVSVELQNLTCADIIYKPADGQWRWDAVPPRPAGGRSDRRVWDISMLFLALLKRRGDRKHLKPPGVRVLPGHIVSEPLIVFDAADDRVARWLKRRCVQIRADSVDLSTVALETLHAETLDNIRANKPVEAADGMYALADLHEPMWQAYQAHDLQYDEKTLPPRFWRPLKTVGERITGSLDAEVRAAATSEDEQVRREATQVPLHITGGALKFRAGNSVKQSLRLLDSVYEAVLYDLTDGGRHPLPATGFAASRLYKAFESLLAFTNAAIQGKIDPAQYDGGAAAMGDAALTVADFAVTQLEVAQKTLMTMLRRAIRVQDAGTLCAVVRAWTMPGRYLVEERPPDLPFAPVEPVPARLQGLGPRLDRAQDELHARFLCLLAYAFRGLTGSEMIAATGLNGVDLVGQLAGFFDNTPVIKIWGLHRKLIIFDLTRFATLELTGSDDGTPGHPILKIAERKAADTAGGEAPSLADKIRFEMAQVEITAQLPGRISIIDNSACQILDWDGQVQ
jgi:hypothetical protein